MTIKNELKMIEKSNIFKINVPKSIIILALITFCFSSCSKKEMNIGQETISVIKNQLSSDEIIFNQEGKDYTLKVISTNLKTKLGKELGASISALVLYEEVVKNNVTLDYDTKFNISFTGDKLTYTYQLQDLSDAIKAKEVVEETITRFENENAKMENYTCSNDIKDLIKIDWLKVEENGIAGFQIKKNKICDKNLETITYHIIINPQNIHLVFNLDKKDKQIIQISEL